MIRGAISIAGRRSGTIGGSNFFAAASTATGRRPISATAFSAISARTSPTLQSSVGLDSDDEGEAMRPNNCHGSLTKIVATIGPTSEQLPVLQELVHAGINVMRLNFSHATVEEVELRTTNLKACKVRRIDDKMLLGWLQHRNHSFLTTAVIMSMILFSPLFQHLCLGTSRACQ